MPHFQVLRKINRIENRLCKIEKSVEDQLEGTTKNDIKNRYWWKNKKLQRGWPIWSTSRIDYVVLHFV